MNNELKTVVNFLRYYILGKTLILDNEHFTLEIYLLQIP